ncbi:hypothetical protein [Desulfocicer vacuolatum]|uniref:hypothetical protein n=1 Tax=Desulfocicer vacuolatum TaxID=2298 RepID=UPI001BAF5C9F|nr:hypothetical protein [Desulfocicer vacuolatum]
MKYSANPGSISSFVVGKTGSEYGPPVKVILNIPTTMFCFSPLIYLTSQVRLYRRQQSADTIK